MNQSKRYSPETKIQAVFRLIKGEATVVELSREIGCHPTAVGEWRDKFLAEAHHVFTPQAPDGTEKRLADYERVIGRLTLENHFLKKVFTHVR